MSVCQYCQREVPGLEKVCKVCFSKLASGSTFQAPGMPKWSLSWDSEAKGFDYRENIHYPPRVWGWALAGVALGFAFLHFVGLWVSMLVMVASDLVIQSDIWDRRSRRSTLSTIVLVIGIVPFAAWRFTERSEYMELFAAAACVFAALVLIDRNRII